MKQVFSDSSGYGAVYKRLYALPESRLIVGRIEKALSEAKLHSVDFKVRKSYMGSVGKPIEVSALWKVQLTDGITLGFEVNRAHKLEEMIGQGFNIFPSKVMEAMSTVLPSFTGVATEHFGTTVPTYGCSQSIILTGEKTVGTGHAKRNVRKDGFSDWSKRKLDQDLGLLAKEATERVGHEILTTRASNVYKDTKKKAIARFVMDEISKTLDTYKYLGRETIEQAINEFFAQEIVDS